jgi:hypothetical protein
MSGSAAGGNNYEGEFHFKLSEECKAIDIKEPPNIKLEIRDNGGETKRIVSFKVTVKNASTEEEALEIARARAKRVVDILAVYSGRHLGYFPTGGQTTPRPTAAATAASDRKGKVSKTFTVKYDIESGKPLDLSKGNIVQAINSRDPPNKDLTFIESSSYANEGLGAHANDLYRVMIKQFHLALGSRPEARK